MIHTLTRIMHVCRYILYFETLKSRSFRYNDITVGSGCTFVFIIPNNDFDVEFVGKLIFVEVHASYVRKRETLPGFYCKYLF